VARPSACQCPQPPCLPLNMTEHQNWQATKEPSELPMKRRAAMKPAGFATAAMPGREREAGAAALSRRAARALPLALPRRAGLPLQQASEQSTQHAGCAAASPNVAAAVRSWVVAAAARGPQRSQAPPIRTRATAQGIKQATERAT
jgi:hypothetical protein